jgi:hypothetical protein
LKNLCVCGLLFPIYLIIKKHSNQISRRVYLGGMMIILIHSGTELVFDQFSNNPKTKKMMIFAINDVLWQE